MKLKLRVLTSLVAIAAVGAIGTSTAGASTTATQYFTIVQTSLDGPQSVIAVGPISATGTDIAVQTANTIAAIKKIVEEAGFQMTDIVSVTVYVTDVNEVAKMNEIYKKLMPDPKPARATVQVAGLIGGAKIEISAIAVKH